MNDNCAIKCKRCKLRFVPTKNYQKVCLPCWKVRQGYQLSKADEALMLLQEVLEEFVRDLQWERQQLREKEALSPARIVELIQLCHPDRHNGSEKATEITKWLLEMRDR